MEICLFFLREFIKSGYITLNTTKLLLKISEDLLALNSQDNEIIKKISNPVKIFVLIAEVLSKLSKKHSILDFNITRLKDKCLEYSVELLNLIEEDNVFREIILEKDLSNRILLDIICNNNFLVLLKNKLTEKVLDELWDGPFQINGSFFETSYNYSALVASHASKDYDIYTNLRKGVGEYSEDNYKCNFTHFKVWRKNIYIKFYLELFITIFLLACFQIVSLVILSKWQGIMTMDANETSTLQKEVSKFIYGTDIFSPNVTTTEYVDLMRTCNTSSLNNETKTFLIKSQDFYLFVYERIDFISNWMLFLYWFSYIFLALPVSYILRYIFSIKFKKPEYGLTLIGDIVLFFGILFYKIFWHQDYLNDINSISKNHTHESINCFSYLKDFSFSMDLIKTDPYSNELMLFSFISVILWVRFILMIRGTKTFGPIIVIFFLSFNGILTYLIIFLLVTLAYASFAILNFYNIDSYIYKNIFFSLFYFTSVSLGGDSEFEKYDDVSNQDPDTSIPWLGATLILVIVIFNSIILFNIIVALLTNIYEKYNTYSRQLFIQKKIEMRRKFTSDDVRYDSLLINVFPFDVITFPLALLFIFSKNETFTNFINKSILWINFSLYSFLYIIFYLTITSLMVPFSFFKVVFSKFVQIFITDIQQYFTLFKVLSFLFYLFFGLIFHLYYFINDFIVFLRELNKQDVPLLTENENSGKYTLKASLLKILLLITHEITDSIKVTIFAEKFFEILLKSLDIDEENFEEIRDMIENYNSENFPKTINEDFNIYNNIYADKFEKRGINYHEFCDFLCNFWDDRYVIEINSLKNILLVYSENTKLAKWFKKVSDKTFSVKEVKKQMLLSAGIGSSLERNKSKNMLNGSALKESSKTANMISLCEYNTLNNNTNVKETKINFNSPMIELDDIPNLNNKFDSKKFKGNFFENLLKKKAFADLIFVNLIKNKSEKIKNLQNSKEKYKIPIISRNTVYIFLSGLKEYQSEITKKISENLMKNQKYLLDIHKIQVPPSPKKLDTTANKKNEVTQNQNTNPIRRFTEKFKTESKKSVTKVEEVNKTNKMYLSPTIASDYSRVSPNFGFKSIKIPNISFDTEINKNNELDLSNLAENQNQIDEKGENSFSLQDKKDRKGIFKKFWEKREELGLTTIKQNNLSFAPKILSPKNSSQQSNDKNILILNSITEESDRTIKQTFRGSKQFLAEYFTGTNEAEIKMIKKLEETNSSNIQKLDQKINNIEKRIDGLEKGMEEILSFTKLIYEQMNSIKK